MESLGTLFVVAALGVLLVGLLGGVIAAVAVTRWRRRAIRALEIAEKEQGRLALECSPRPPAGAP